MILQSLRVVSQGSQGELLLGGRSLYRWLGGFTLIIIWVPFLMGHRISLNLLIPLLFGINLFYSLTTFRILQLLATISSVNWRTLTLAAAGYVQLGLTCGKLAILLEVLQPGSFDMGSMPGGEEVLQRLKGTSNNR
ncbi:MAG: hypothetical protein FJ077_15720, partial [Cyanobacteria bacterium K_DeepCast_35m_m2_023]|nr:hypothetical protein [Cyanobacteria bacterium K_DeepCast_35m_m2_023]